MENKTYSFLYLFYQLIKDPRIKISVIDSIRDHFLLSSKYKRRKYCKIQFSSTLQVLGIRNPEKNVYTKHLSVRVLPLYH